MNSPKAQTLRQPMTTMYNQTPISFLLERKAVKNVNLRIRPDGTVYVSADKDCPEELIIQYVKERGEFILKELFRIKRRNYYLAPPLQYVSGETVRILGRDQRLKVETGSEESVRSDGVFIFLTVPDKNDVKTKKRLLDKYLDDLRRKTFMEIVNAVYPSFRKYDVPMPVIHIRDMNTRWGSCQPKRGIITLNSRLLAAPKSCIEYVVTHEFCHFRFTNHNRDFYNFLHVLIPDWKQRKMELEKM